MKKALFFVFVILSLASCEKESSSLIVSEPDQSIDLRATSDKVNICHYSEEDGSWQVINISPDALAAHQAHGDAVDMDGDGYFTNDKCSEEDCDDATYDLDNSCLLLVTLPDGSLLYVTPADQITGAPANGVQWGGEGTDIPGLAYIASRALALADFDGAANTQAIVTALGAGDYAAKVCADLVYNGCDDWYLPAQGELNVMYQQLGPTTNGFGGSGDMPTGVYWSSSEGTAFDAWEQNFITGVHNIDGKGYPASCRCVRR